VHGAFRALVLLRAALASPEEPLAAVAGVSNLQPTVPHALAHVLLMPSHSASGLSAVAGSASSASALQEEKELRALFAAMAACGVASSADQQGVLDMTTAALFLVRGAPPHASAELLCLPAALLEETLLAGARSSATASSSTASRSAGGVVIARALWRALFAFLLKRANDAATPLAPLDERRSIAVLDLAALEVTKIRLILFFSFFFLIFFFGG